MADYQVLGNYIVSDKIKESPYASVHRGILAPEGRFEKFVLIHKFKEELNGSSDFFRAMSGTFRAASKISGAAVASVLDLQQDEEEGPYAVYQFDDGKFLDDVIRRSADEGFPFSMDHILLIASKTSAALAFCYGKGLTHGFLTPASIHISFEGDVKLYDILTAPHLPALVASNPELKSEYEEFIHPDVFAGKRGEVYDVFSIGTIIFRLLTGKPFLEGGQVPNVTQKVDGAVLGSSSFGDEPIPADIKEILIKALDVQSGYKSMAEFNEVVENLIFSGDYSPTTFNLAFFMHSLYREESEQSAKLLDLEKTANYAGYFVKGGESVEVKKMPKGLIFGLIALVVVIGVVGGYFFMQKQKAEKERLLAEQQAKEQIMKQQELARKKQEEIEAMKKQMEEEMKKLMDEVSKEADKRAKEILLKRMEEEQKKRMEAIQKAEEEKKRIEEERKRKEELLRQQQAAEEKKKQEEEAARRKAEEEKKRQEEEARRKQLEEQKKQEEQQKALFGQVVGLSEVDVEPKLIYQEKPKINPGWRVKGTLTLTALVDENGNTTDVKVIRGLATVTRGAKLAERAVVDTVRKWKYTPALKDGVAVKVWITVRISI